MDQIPRSIDDTLFLEAKGLANPFAGGYGGSPLFPSYSAPGGPWDVEHQIGRALHVAVSRFQGTNVDWAREAGDLTMSNLVMPPVHWLAGVLPEAPLEVVETDQDGKETPIPDHPLTRLWSKPNPFFSTAQICDAIALSWIVNGNVYFVKIQNALGEPLQIWWIPPYLMNPVWPFTSSTTFIERYDYRVEGGYISYDPDQVLHFRNSLDHRYLGRLGVSPLASGMREIVGDSEWANYQVSLAKRSGVPPFLLSPKVNKNTTGVAGLTPEERKFVREDFDRQRIGDNRGKSMFLTLGIEAKRLGQNPSELNLEELRYQGQELISSLTGIPSEVMNFGCAARRSTYNNVKEANARAYESVAIPMFRRLEDTMDRQILPDFYPKRLVPPNVRTRFNDKKIRALQEDEDSYSLRICNEYDMGLIKRKEGKEALNYAFDEELDDVYKSDIISARITERVDNLDNASDNQDLAKDSETLNTGDNNPDGKDQPGKDSGKGPAKSRQFVSTGRKNLNSGNVPSANEIATMERSWITNAPKRSKRLLQRKRTK